jgi:hypothetical protein
MPSDIQVKTPAATLAYQFDWSEEVPNGVSLLAVSHQVPNPLVLVAQSYDATALISKVSIAGGVHGGIYVVCAYAQLDTGEYVPGQFTLRVMAPKPE